MNQGKVATCRAIGIGHIEEKYQSLMNQGKVATKVEGRTVTGCQSINPL